MVNNLKNLAVKTEETLTKANHYFLWNGQMINPNKTQCIFINNRKLLSRIPNNTTVKLDANTITPGNVKNLVLYIDRYMTFDVHVNELNQKIMGTLIYLHDFSDNFQKPTRVIIVSSLVLSFINYCMLTWETFNGTLLYIAQKLQNFAAKVAVGGMRKYDHVPPALKI